MLRRLTLLYFVIQNSQLASLKSGGRSLFGGGRALFDGGRPFSVNAMGTIEGSYFGIMSSKISEKYYKRQLWNPRQKNGLPTFRIEGNDDPKSI